MLEFLKDNPRSLAAAYVSHTIEHAVVTVKADNDGYAMIDEGMNGEVISAIIAWKTKIKDFRFNDYGNATDWASVDLSDTSITRVNGLNAKDLEHSGVVTGNKETLSPSLLETVGVAANNGDIISVQDARILDGMFSDSIQRFGLDRRLKEIEKREFYFVVHPEFVENVRAFNAQNKKHLLTSSVRPGRGGAATNHQELQAHIDLYIYERLQAQSKLDKIDYLEILARHELAHIDIFNVQKLKDDGVSDDDIIQRKDIGRNGLRTWQKWNAYKDAYQQAGVSPEELEEKFINADLGYDTSAISDLIARFAEAKPFRLENYRELQGIIRSGQGAQQVGAITNAADETIVEETFQTPKITHKIGETNPEPKMKNRRGQVLGIVDFLLKCFAPNRTIQREGNVGLVIMMPGQGTRFTPITEREFGIKPMSPMLIRTDKNAEWLSAGEASLYTWTLVAQHLDRLGFKGLAFKWGDEPQISANDMYELTPETMNLEDADIVRFSSIEKVDEDKAKNKEWFYVDENGNYHQLSRRPRTDLLKAMGKNPADQDTEALAHIGSPAFSDTFLQALINVFGTEAFATKWLDVDGILVEGLTYTDAEWKAFAEDANFTKKVEENDAQCGGTPGSFRAMCIALKAEINRLKGKSPHEDISMKVISFGKGLYWGDMGQLKKAREAFHQVADNTHDGHFARVLAAIEDVLPDKWGNRIVGEDCIYPDDGSIRNSVLIHTKIYGKANIDNAVIVDSVLGNVTLKKDSVLYDCTADTVTGGERVFAFKSVRAVLDLENDWVHTSIPKNVQDMSQGLEDWLCYIGPNSAALEMGGMDDVKAWIEKELDDKLAKEPAFDRAKAYQDWLKAPVDPGCAPVYKNPHFGNPDTFINLHTRMRDRTVSPASVENGIQTSFVAPLITGMETIFEDNIKTRAAEAAARKNAQSAPAVPAIIDENAATPGIFASSGTPFAVTASLDDNIILANIDAGKVEQALMIFKTSKANKTTELATLSNILIKYYTAAGETERRALDKNISQFYSGVINFALSLKDGNTAYALQRISANVILITSALSRGIREAASLSVTDKDTMLGHIEPSAGKTNRDRQLTYLEAGKDLARADREGAVGIFNRGCEAIAKMAGEMVEALKYTDQTGTEIDNMVAYIMLHGLVATPDALKDATANGAVSTYHHTVFVNTMIPGTTEFSSTGFGHFQGKKLDIKQVTEGRFLQVIDIYNEEAVCTKTLLHVVDKGEYTLALPGTFDRMIPLTRSASFDDFSIDFDQLVQMRLPGLDRDTLMGIFGPLCKLSPGEYASVKEKMDNKINGVTARAKAEPKRAQTVCQAHDVNGQVKLSFHIPADGDLIQVSANDKSDMTKHFTWVNFSPALAEIMPSLVKTYRDMDMNTMGELLRRISGTIQKGENTKEATTLPLAPENAIDTAYQRAIQVVAERMLRNNEPIECKPAFNLGVCGAERATPYTWGEPISRSYTLEKKGIPVEERADYIIANLTATQMNFFKNLYVQQAPAALFDAWLKNLINTTQVSEQLLGNGMVNITLDDDTIVPVSIDAIARLWPEQVFGVDHIAQYGPSLGLTAKVLTSAQPLSLQMHNFQEMIVPLENGKAYLGIKENVTAEQLANVIRGVPQTINGSIVTDVLGLLNEVEVEAGKAYIVPAFIPHAYGKVRVYEVKAVTPEEDKNGTISFLDRLQYIGMTKDQIRELVIQAEKRVNSRFDGVRQILEHEMPAVITKPSDMRTEVFQVVNSQRLNKDLSTMGENDLAKTMDWLKTAEKAKALEVTDISRLEFAPRLLSSPGASQPERFEIVGKTDRFTTFKYTIQAGHRMKAMSPLAGRAHVLYVAEGSVEMTTYDSHSKPETRVLEAGSEHFISAHAGNYILTTMTGKEATIYTQIQPLKENDMDKANLNTFVETAQKESPVILEKTDRPETSEVGLTPRIDQATELELVNGRIVALRQDGLSHDIVTINTEKTGFNKITPPAGCRYAAIERISGKVTVGLTSPRQRAMFKGLGTLDESTALPLIVTVRDGTLLFTGKGKVKVTYANTPESAIAYGTLAGVQEFVKGGRIQSALGTKGIQIVMTKAKADALYRTSGQDDYEGRIKAEKEFLSKVLGVDVQIATLDRWNNFAVDTNMVQVAWMTDEEIRTLSSSSNDADKTALQRLAGIARVPAIPDMLIRTLVSTGDKKGWFYTRELEGLSVMLACISQADMKPENTYAQALQNVVNLFTGDSVKNINDLKKLLPMSAEEAADIKTVVSLFKFIIEKILIKLPAKPFNPQDELNRRRQVLWSA
ncbi:MAG: hypothetical protein PHS37_04475 [Candidatus Omnitrophica bacterium]|nr:hypothetical protein [Candidatus Omnitrophota bacterium]